MEDIAGTALCMGFLAGAFFTAFILALLNVAGKKNFKSYYLECNESKRKDIDKALGDLYVCSKDLVEYTNTNYFKKLHNSINDLYAFLKRRSLN
jgi:hypothetical protein